MTTGLINVTNANGSANSAGNFVVSGSNVEFSLPIGFGESVQFLFTPPPSGQQLTNVGTMSFTGSAGQRISLIVEDIVCGPNTNPPPYAYAQISVISPSGSVLASVPFQNYFFTGNPTAFAWIDALLLPATGQYTILIDPNQFKERSTTRSAIRNPI